MFQYRQVLVRLRVGDSERELARSRLMGRQKLAAFRSLAAGAGWLDPEQPLPTDAAIAQVLGAARQARTTVSSVEPWCDLVGGCVEQGVQGVAIHAALCRTHGLPAATPRCIG